MRRHTSLAILALALALALPDGSAAQERVPAPPDAKLYLIAPSDGAELSSPVTIRFGLRGMGIAPAGVASPATGHHHLILDAALPDLAKPIPADEQHRHFGKGQTEVTLHLEPGEHTLQLLLGDKNHVPFEPAVASKRITIRVR